MKKDNKQKSLENKEPFVWEAEEEKKTGPLEEFQEIFKKLGYEYFVYITLPTKRKGMVKLYAVFACVKKDLADILLEETEKGAMVATEKIELSELMGFNFEKLN